MRQSETIVVNVFPGGFNWAIYVGQERGFFANESITVELQGTSNSIQQMTDFAAGRFDIAMTAIDNIVAYAEGQGEAPIGAQPQFFAFMGSDSGFLNLVASDRVQTIRDLAGRTVSVDAMTTGYAFVLYEMLRLNGLDKTKDDYVVKRSGGMAQRWKALLEGQCDATLLSAPYNIIAVEAGFRNLGRAVDVIGPYQGNVAAARRDWANKNREKVIAFIRGYRKSIRWLYEPDNRTEATAILRRNLASFSAETADAAYRELLDPRYGFFKTCDIDLEGVKAVLELRRRHFPAAGVLAGAETYCDLSFGTTAGY